MHSQFMLEGQVAVDNRDEIISSLRQENRRLSDEVLEVRRELREAHAAVAALRTQLHPLYRALQAVFGEMEHVAAGEIPAPNNPRVSAVWESWKQKLGGMSAKFIDALLLHGEMSVAQLRVAMQCRQQTVYDVSSKLGKLGLLNKNGGKYSLKQL